MREQSVIAIARALNGAGVRYLVVGGLAVVAHGFVRLTADVDLVVALDRDNIVRALNALSRIGYRPRVPVTPEAFADPALRETWIHDKNMLVFQLWSDRHLETAIDIFVREPFDFDAEYQAAKRVETEPGCKLPIVTLPTLLRMKREAGRPKDLLDIEALQADERTHV